MRVDDGQILSISQELWENQLGLRLAPATAAGERTRAEDRTWASSIKATGAWQGTILFECPESVARHAAAVLFATDADDASESDIADALKELADMIGRRVRPLLPESTKLSRAAVVAGEAPAKASRELSDVRLSCEGRPMRIAVYEVEPEPEPAAAV
jgi:chemotaxis protein CheX